MKKSVKVVGLLLAANGFLLTTFATDYIKALRTDRLGPRYRRFIDSLIERSDATLRVVGAMSVVAGTSLLSIAVRGDEKLELEEVLPKERFTEMLRGLASSMEDARV